jgi:hypothetical protein
MKLASKRNYAKGSKLNKRLDQESKFMLLEPDERDLSEEQQRSMISGIIDSTFAERKWR